MARAAAVIDAELVMAMGGDGTLNEVVNGLTAGEHWPRLGLIPGGTANDFAAALGLPEGVGEAVEVALRGREVEVDVGAVNGRCFMNVSTGGLGAAATRSAKGGLKRLLGPLAYGLAAVRQLRAYQPLRASFVVDEHGVYDGEFSFYAVGNSWRTGGGMQVTPAARVDDVRLDLVVVCAMKRAELLKLLPQVRAGTHLERDDVLYFRGARIRVDAGAALQVNADGEPLSARSLRYSLLPRRLRVMRR